MIDEYFEYFLQKFGEPAESIQATKQQIEAYRGILPEQLLFYWEQVGFSGFQNGLFWITNPSEFEDIVDAYLDGTEFQDYDNYHVIARGAYGQLYLWGERTGYSLEITPHLNWIETVGGDEEKIAQGEADIAMQSFFGFQEVSDLDIENNSKPLFPSILKKHGALTKDEVFVFTPYLFMGGKKSVDKVTKENIHVFLKVMVELGGAEIIDMASMVKNVVKHHS